eukprot:359932-Chlamydomonas_euryale.AAC.3
MLLGQSNNTPPDALARLPGLAQDVTLVFFAQMRRWCSVDGRPPAAYGRVGCGWLSTVRVSSALTLGLGCQAWRLCLRPCALAAKAQALAPSRRARLPAGLGRSATAKRAANDQPCRERETEGWPLPRRVPLWSSHGSARFGKRSHNAQPSSRGRLEPEPGKSAFAAFTLGNSTMRAEPGVTQRADARLRPRCLRPPRLIPPSSRTIARGSARRQSCGATRCAAVCAGKESFPESMRHFAHNLVDALAAVQAQLQAARRTSCAGA